MMQPPLSLMLVYEPDPSLSLLLQEQLAGWHVQHMPQIGDTPIIIPQAVLLASDEDHADMAARLRGAGMIGPIFSVNDDAPAPLIGLPRPLRLPALVAKLSACDGSFIDGAIIGPWRVDLAQRALVDADSQRVERLTDKEFSLLCLLLTQMPETVEREKLQTEIWRYHADADTHTVETHVWRLRQKLEDDPANPRFLMTGTDGYFISR